jgi:hypothetical protein
MPVNGPELELPKSPLEELEEPKSADSKLPEFPEKVEEESKLPEF